MPRRKQERPKHLGSPEELAISLQNGISSDSSSEAESDEHVCGKCRAEYPTLADFLQHKKVCTLKTPVLLEPLDNGTVEVEYDEEYMEDADYDLPPPLPNGLRIIPAQFSEWLLANKPTIQSTLLNAQGPSTNVTLAELENTCVAVAQQGQMNGNPLKDMLCSFQKHQYESYELLKTIANLIIKDTSAVSGPVAAMMGATGLSAPQTNSNVQVVTSPSNAASCIMTPYTQGGRTQDSSLLAMPPTETNTLALLEKQTEKCIQDSMARKSFLNGMDDDNRSKKKQDLDPAARHKCNFCGKLLGSDSALQIHLRSHTGEKPFQCHVCGSSFSTRGNLKVHCQRHKERMELPGFMLEESNARTSIATEGRAENPPSLFDNEGDMRGDICKDQALDFSKSVNGQKSPQAEIHSRSISPNDTSNFTDNSIDGSSDDNIHEDYENLKIDVEQFEEDERDSNCVDDDESQVAHPPSYSSSPNFAPYFLPSPYDNFPSTSQVTPGSNTISNNNGTATAAEGTDILHDPTYYQDLLPRIGSNDNSWESLIEVTKTSETSKLQQLVDNIENKLIEPNQCIICHRVLSCKSALQMHYRTHTGERPYRCKLCNRAFTTKGNLKTHMGVHRTKTTSRLMHQCPVCHRQFPNSVILQQHIRNHTTDHVMQLPPLFNPLDDRPQTLLPPSYPRQFLMQSQLVNVEPLALTSTRSQDESRNSLALPANESVIKPTGVDNNISQNDSRSPGLSGRSSCSPASNIDEAPTDKDTKSTVLNFNQSESQTPPKDEPDSTDDNQKMNGIGSSSEKDRMSDDPMNVDDTKSEGKSSPKRDLNTSNNIQSLKLDIDTRNALEVAENMSAKYSSHANSIIVPLASDRPLPMTLPSDCPIPFNVHGADRHYPPISIPSCTTNYTASLTALENHVKGITSNVTHPLPFPPHYGLGLNISSYFRDYNYTQKSTVASPTASKNGSDISADDRSTPGGAAPTSKGDSSRSSSQNNQSAPKQDISNGVGALDLTPRSSPAFQRPAPTDMKLFQPLVGLPFGPPQHRLSTTCRVCYKTFACNSALEIHYRSHTKERPFRCEVCDRGFSTKGNMRQHMLTHKIRDFPPQAFSTNSNSSSSPSAGSSLKMEAMEEKSLKKSPDEAVKRPAAESLSTPGPSKRSSGQPKHMCQVCHKPFSSGSALQIHMRTHTGDKPFQCTICHRAFTTKGNLKVHMGTHMWNNSTSRRGRRMSLDITPLQLAPGGKPGDFVQAPYFPYLSPFMNGLPPHHPPPKMNEISVIQTAGMGNGASGSASSSTNSAAASTSQQPLALLSSSNKHADRNATKPNQNQHSQGKDIHPPSSTQEMVASWQWKISCNSCNKICASSTELELHVRNNHCNNKESAEADRTD